MCIASKNNNKTDRHDITEILLKVALNTITLKKKRNHSKRSKGHNCKTYRKTAATTKCR